MTKVLPLVFCVEICTMNILMISSINVATHMR